MTTPAPPFAPLPVRARTTLEIFDTAFKLFRRYAGVLLAWSFLSSLINLIPFGEFAYLFTLPLFYGAVACVLAAAVRGQNVQFGQVWGFTKPRYGALLGVLILAGLLFFALLFGVSLGVSLLTVLVIQATSQFGTAAYVLAWIVGIIGGTTLTSLLLAVTTGWFTLAPLVACLEDQHRGSSALGRAWSLLSGSWRKACAVSVVTSLALGAAMAILGSAILFIFYGGFDKFVGASASDSAMLSLVAGWSGFFTLFLTFSMPVQTLIIGVFYLDLRTRKEALDLEWTNYAAQPEPSPEPLAARATAPAPASSPPAAPDQFPSALSAGAVPPAFSATAPTFDGPPPNVAAPPAMTDGVPAVVAASPAVVAARESMTGASQSIVGARESVVDSVQPAIGWTESADGWSQSIADSTESVAGRTESAIGWNQSATDSTESVVGSGESMTGSAPSVPLLPPQVPVIEEAPTQTSDAGFGRPQLVPPPVPTAPPTVPTPPAAPSFAPPRRATDDDDLDFPSSFGGGGRR